MSKLSYKVRYDIDRLRVPTRFNPQVDDRHALRLETGMWSIVDRTWTRALADHIGSRRCLEVFAGRGWLAQALSEYHGVDLVATSRFSTHDGSDKGLVFDVIDMSGTEAVMTFDFEVLIFGWPVADKTAYHTVQTARRFGRQFEIVFIGEPYSTNPFSLSGTASDEFFECCEVIKEIREYRETRGHQGIDVCQIMRMKDH